MSAPATLDSSSVWFITGCSSGLGKSIAQASYNAGHHVVATARNTTALSYLPDDSTRVLKLKLDVTSKDSITSALQSAVGTFGHLDVVVNNAGYALMGDTEVIPEAESRLLVETLFWGPVFVTQGAVRIFREVNPKGRGGTVVNMSSMGGSITVAGNAFYHAGKFALEGFTKSIAQEMQPEWNIRFLLVAPGGVRTNFAGSNTSALKIHPRHPAYNTPFHPLTQMLGFINDPAREATKADPDICAKLLFDTVVRGNDNGKPFPVRLAMGSDAYYIMKQVLDQQVEEIELWKQESESCSPKGDADVAEIRRWRDA